MCSFPIQPCYDDGRRFQVLKGWPPFPPLYPLTFSSPHIGLKLSLSAVTWAELGSLFSKSMFNPGAGAETRGVEHMQKATTMLSTPKVCPGLVSGTGFGALFQGQGQASATSLLFALLHWGYRSSASLPCWNPATLTLMHSVCPLNHWVPPWQ